MNDANGTIDDFSTQWAAFPKNDGFFGGDELLEDYLRPLWLHHRRGYSWTATGVV